MRRFGRQCRGQSKVFVSLVRQTETQLLTNGSPVVGLARAAQAQVQSATHLAEEQRTRLVTQLTVALAAHAQLTTQSRRLPQGKSLSQCKIVNAYDPTIAPFAKARATALPSLAANRALSPSRPPASSLPCSCRWVTPVMPAMSCPWWTKCRPRSPTSPRGPPRPSTRWPAIWP